jgi:hypothetical protein
MKDNKDLKSMARELEPLIDEYRKETNEGIRDGKACEALVNFFKENSKGVTMRDYL